MWLYLGLVAPAGATFARPIVRKESPSRVLLMGGDDAVALGPTLQQLAADDRVDFAMATRPGTSALDWASGGWVQEAIETHRPEAVLLALTPATEELGGELEGAAGGARVLWLPVGGPGSEAVLPRTAVPGWQDDSAKGYAAWAAAAWRVVR